MIDKLINLANELDQRGLVKEADVLDNILKYSASTIAATLDALADMNAAAFRTDKWYHASATVAQRLKNYGRSFSPSEIKNLRNAIYASKGPGFPSSMVRSMLLQTARAEIGTKAWEAAKNLSSSGARAGAEAAEGAARAGAEAAEGAARANVNIVENVTTKTLSEGTEGAAKGVATRGGAKVVGKVLLPLGVAMDIATIGWATYEGVKAFQAVGEREQSLARTIVKNAIGGALMSTLHALKSSGEDVSEMHRVQLEWRTGKKLSKEDANILRELLSVVDSATWKDNDINTYIGQAMSGSYSEYVDTDAIHALYNRLMQPLA